VTSVLSDALVYGEEAKQKLWRNNNNNSTNNNTFVHICV
jgi:hypothetical protein